MWLAACALPVPPGFACDGTPSVPVRLLIVFTLLLIIGLALTRMGAFSAWLRSGNRQPMLITDRSASSAATTPAPDPATVHLLPRRWFGQVLTGSEPPAIDDFGKVQGLAKIRDHDRAFDEGAFLAAIERVFFAVLQAWTRQKPQLSQGVMGPVIWEQQKAQLQEDAARGQRNVMDALSFSSAVIAAASSDDRYDTITVRIRASSADYALDISTGKPIGSNTRVEDWAEDWIFQRPSSATTPEGGGAIAQPCPNCGAPVAVDVTTICPFCNGPVISGKFVWRLTRIDRL
jgi:predicted lipid-binding transport protein (Tim44 family)